VERTTATRQPGARRRRSRGENCIDRDQALLTAPRIASEKLALDVVAPSDALRARTARY